MSNDRYAHTGACWVTTTRPRPRMPGTPLGSSGGTGTTTDHCRAASASRPRWRPSSSKRSTSRADTCRPTRTVPRDPRVNRRPRTVMALMLLAEAFLAQGAPEGRGSGFQVVVNVDEAVLAHDTDGVCELDDG